MKKLRNIGIYYIILTLISIVLSFYAVLYLFIPLLPILVLGIIFIIIYYISNKKGLEFKNTSILQPQVITIFLIILPFVLYSFISWYVWRPYDQTIILPEKYEGVVAIQYDRPDGQPEKWTGGFLGIGSSRLIEVNSTGIAKTQFKFHSNAIPFLGLKQTYHNKGGLKIYYQNDLNNEIVKGADGKLQTYKNRNLEHPYIYFTGLAKYPLIIFVITKPKDYNNYFMSEEEMINEYKAKHNQEPILGTFFNVRKLNNRYNKYYRLQEYYFKN